MPVETNMQLPIPSDWDGETWRSICIQWPDSVQWRAILRGLLSTPYRGRFWDRRTGSIIAAQNVGRTIIDSNFDFPVCIAGLESGMVKVEKYWRVSLKTAQNANSGMVQRPWDTLESGEIDEDFNIPAYAPPNPFTAIQLQAGTYRFHWRCAGYQVGFFGTVLHHTDIDGSSNPVNDGFGNLTRAEESPNRNRYSEGWADVVIEGPKWFRVAFENSLGNATGHGQVTIADFESYTAGVWEIWKMEDLGDIQGPAGPPGPIGTPGPTGPQGQVGPGVLMRADGSMIQYAQEDEPTVWFDVIDLCDLSCGIGEPPGEWPAACELATRVTHAIRELLTFTNKAKQENDTWAGFLSAVYGFYFALVQDFWGDVAASIMASVYYSYRSNIPDWFGSVTQAQWDDLKCLAYSAIIVWEGVWNEHTGTLLRDWCYNERDQYTEEEDLYQFWNWCAAEIDKVPYQIGWMATVYDLAELGTIDCEECGEGLPEWGAHWDFTAESGMGGWVIQSGGGEYLPAIGWIAAQSGPQQYSVRMQGYFNMDATPGGAEVGYLDGALMEWVTDEGTTFEAIYDYDHALRLASAAGIPVIIHWQKVIDSGPNPLGYYTPSWNYTADPVYPGGFPFETHPTNPVLFPSIYLHDGEYTPGTNTILRKVTFFGRGHNPFAAFGWDSVPYAPLG